VDDRQQLDELVAWLLSDENGYTAARVLPDGSVAAVIELLTTRAIVLGVTRFGWTTRFCFADRGLALQRFDELQSEDDEPEGCIARRGRVSPKLNPRAAWPFPPRAGADSEGGEHD